MNKNLYEVLGVSKNASSEEIKKTFRQRSVQEHPDKGGDSEKYKELTNAYSILGDKDRREKYDRTGSTDENDQGLPPGQGFPFNPFAGFPGFSNFPGFGGFPGFGNFRPGGQPIRRSDIKYTLFFTQKEAFFGINKNIKITIEKKCMSCLIICNICKGFGITQKVTQQGSLTQISNSPCQTCSGSGKMHNNSCEDCKGTVDIKDVQIINVNFPPGVRTGTTKIIEGLGEQKTTPEETSGNLILILELTKDVFSLRGDDLVYNVSINFAESIIGKMLTIPYYGDENMTIDTKIFNVIKPGKEYIVQGKGMSKENGEYGNMYIVFDVIYPLELNLTKEDEEYIKKIFNN